MTDELIQNKIQNFFSKYPERSYEKGQILLYAGEEPHHVFYLVKGRIREYDISYRGDEIVVNIFRPRAFLPMSWAINKGENKYFYRAEEAVVINVIPVEDALKFLKDNPDILYDLLSRVYRGADVLIGRLVQLMSGSAKSRLIFELVNEARRVPGNEKKLKLEVNESDLAARTGLSRETVSREIHDLKNAGMVRVDTKGVWVQDLSALLAKLES